MQVSVTERSSLVVAGDVTIEHLDVDGALVVQVVPGAKLTIRSLVVRNSGWKVVRLPTTFCMRIAQSGERISSWRCCAPLMRSLTLDT